SRFRQFPGNPSGADIHCPQDFVRNFARNEPLRTTPVTTPGLPFLGRSRRKDTALFEGLDEIITRPRVERRRKPVRCAILRWTDSNTIGRRARYKRGLHGLAVCSHFV